MGTRLFLVCQLAGVAFLAMLAALSLTPAEGRPYLAGLGPIPLRFVSRSVSTTAVVSAPNPLDASTPVTAAEVVVSDLTHITAIETPAQSAVTNSPPTTERVTDAAITDSTQPAYMLLPPITAMTPQVLAEYFKPGAGRTNAAGAAVFVPVDVRFTPPVPKSDLSSRATYKIQ